MNTKASKAVVSAPAASKADKPAVAVKLANELFLSAAHETHVRMLRPALAGLAASLFSKPVTVADAAAAIKALCLEAGNTELADCMDLSVKDAADEDKAVIQRVRVTLGRALEDAKLRAKGNRGRKAAGKPASVKATDKADASTVATIASAKGKKELAATMIGNLTNLSDDGLSRLLNAVKAEQARRAADAPKAAAKKAA